ncbi:ArsR/SmtB family transcription factor [Marinivivus vitaminiproducens]|uniref:ArsR/SmtB family transcription factor n=1 Tax=Marinivivus vitaminiproducens TaxID=3035935 RepID=UPI0027A9B49F|nr:metalloregulator ArsR/SmtB family transcription factor [Geminicoccaceae bacterium SCSIO 64248]
MSAELPVDDLLHGLRAAAEPSRLRLLAVCAHGEWTVSELTQVMGQSQPRISRHLKLLADAGLVERFREGAWVFYRLAQGGGVAALAHHLCDLLPSDDPELQTDRRRLDAVREQRERLASAHFAALAERFDEQACYLDEAEVARALRDLFGDHPPDRLLDVGTGTGRILQLMAPHVGQGLGVDSSQAMLTVARSKLDGAQIRNCQVRLGDMYALPAEDRSFDAVVLHQVLHYAYDPLLALREASRALRPGGTLVVIDFARHELEFLRSEQAHRRLGFADGEMAEWFKSLGLTAAEPIRLAGDPLTVVLWPAGRTPVAAVVDATYQHHQKIVGSDVA